MPFCGRLKVHSMLRALPSLLALCLSTLPLATAQDTTLSTTPSAVTTTAIPTGSDFYASPPASDPGANGDSLTHYYFVFAVFIVCLAGLGCFILFKRKRRLGAAQYDRESALARDLDAWQPSRGRTGFPYGRRPSAEASREEGLNEHGEAPPPYVPKPANEDTAESSAGHGPAVPLQTLSREHVGLKPPDYMEAEARPMLQPERRPSADIVNAAQRPGA